MANLAKIEGIGGTYAAKLAQHGLRTTGQLLKAGATRRGRSDIAAKSGISETMILEWVNRADLFRIKGVGEEYSDLLENAGVDTVAELAQRNAANLHEALKAENARKKVVRQLPSAKMVANWVAQAKSLPRAVEY
jgi:predicted flap endonuclease-1-like 5' DNA nuclease